MLGLQNIMTDKEGESCTIKLSISYEILYFSRLVVNEVVNYNNERIK